MKIILVTLRNATFFLALSGSALVPVATAYAQSAAPVPALNKGLILLKQGQLVKLNAEVAAYLLEHKMAVAALVGGFGGGSVCIDTTNQYTEDAKATAGVVVAVSVLYAIFNWDEMTEVAGVMAKADMRAKELQKEIKALGGTY